MNQRKSEKHQERPGRTNKFIQLVNAYHEMHSADCRFIEGYLRIRAMDITLTRHSGLTDTIVHYMNADSLDQQKYYARKILRKDPYNLAAQFVLETEKTLRAEDALKIVLDREESRLQKMEYPAGKYSQYDDTRAFLYGLYVQMVFLCNRKNCYEKAAAIGEKILYYDETDEVVFARIILTHLYAVLDDRKKLDGLNQKYWRAKMFSCVSFMPYAFIAFRHDNLEEAEHYLQKIFETNKDAKRYLRAMKNGREKQIEVEAADPVTCYPWTELQIMFAKNKFLYENNPDFMKWIYDQVSLKRK